NKQRVEVGAVAALGIASPERVSAAPAGAALVVLHGAEDVLVEGAGALEVGRAAGGFLSRDLGGQARHRHQAVGLEEALPFARSVVFFNGRSPVEETIFTVWNWSECASGIQTRTRSPGVMLRTVNS